LTDTDSRARLEEFFRRRSDDPATVKVTEFEVITGGYSRAMARVWIEDAAGRRGYVVRSDPPPGQSIIDTDRAQEWAVLSALHESGTVPVPPPRWFDASGDELGSPAIVMDLIESESLLSKARREVTDEPDLAMADQLGATAAVVHTFDVTVLPDHLERPTSWDDYIDQRIQRWVDAEQAHVSSDPVMRYVASWLRDNKPPPVPFGLVHGDFQMANVLVDRNGDYVLIDWELTHIGDPREDLGWGVLGLALQAPEVVLDDDAFYSSYRERTGFTEEQVNPATVAFFTVLGAGNVFLSVMEQLAGVATGATTAMMVAYMSNAVVGMHNEFMKAIDLNEAIRSGAR
jgi:aminoglycoside phosphotransferase (APT) family kinase protein